MTLDFILTVKMTTRIKKRAQIASKMPLRKRSILWGFEAFRWALKHNIHYQTRSSDDSFQQNRLLTWLESL